MSGRRDEQEEVLNSRELEEVLSSRELDVLNLLAQGERNQDIASRLMVSVKTVEAHLTSIYAKLGVRSRTQAILWLKSAPR